MRDRRNTILSMSSTDSTDSAATRSSNDGWNEKKHDELPDSPTLPLPATTKENWSRPRTGKAMAAKIVLAVVGVVMLWRYWCGAWMYSMPQTVQTAAQTQSQADMEWIAANALPDEPTALVVADPVGTSKWTISIPHNFTFPLRSQYYKDMCSQGDTMREGLSNDPDHSGGNHWWRRHGYFAKDQTYLDVAEAEKLGALPKSKVDFTNVCESSMTFVLDEEEASFGRSLLLLWMSYGLAKQEGRSFFIDDSRWAWGKFSSYFLPPPAPKCLRPPPHQIVPCPRSARHVVVSSTTAPWTFGPSFEKEFQGRHKHGLSSDRRIFEVARSGYEALFKLTGEDALYAASRIAKLKDDAAAHHGSVVGMQIRRGDVHPFEYEYSRDYLPLERYASGARSLLQSCHGKASDLNDLEYIGSPLVLASDDPGVINSAELQQAIAPFSIQRAQERIQLATKDTLDQSLPKKPVRAPGSAYVKHVDENTGWEGGFFSGLFFSLGGAKAGSQNDQAVQLRQFVGRAYLLDLAVLGASDGVVCAVSSATCRAAAVVMGWDAVKAGKWVNIDDGRSWSWNGRR
ncbi:hypothetical protein Slin14017_G109000 [Septoria linicola]|nr:hypothetical protein Slin14017_G109000 [Septoria linicola]